MNSFLVTKEQQRGCVLIPNKKTAIVCTIGPVSLEMIKELQEHGMALARFNGAFQPFSTEFLFIKGDPNLRHNLPNHGEFYLLEAFFLILGFF